MTSISDVAARSRVPRGVLKLGKSVAEGIGSATSRFRLPPDYLIIGGQRCGTTALNRYLWEHPNVLPAMYKELHFFSLEYARGLDWYLGHFPTAGRRAARAAKAGGVSITGEATPYYLFHPLSPERVAETLRDVRLIAVLRDPVARAISHYHHERRLGAERLELLEALEVEDERLAGEEERIVADPTYASFAHQHFSYQARGRYAGQLRRWLERFGPERLLIVDAAALFSDPAREFARVTGFLGLPTVARSSFETHNALRYRADDDAVAYLRERSRPHNEELYELVGADFGWG